MKRREALRALGLTTTGIALAPQLAVAQEKKPASAKFRFCLNTSTISGQKAGVQKYIEIASQVGYDGVELWVQDVKDYKEQGNSLRYKQLLDLGRQTGVMPQLEFWGSSPVFYSMGQALMVAAAANDPDVHILPDVYHLFRGGSGFECLKMVNGNIIDVIHFNDYPSSIPREQQKDSDRLYPGDGVAPFKEIIADLSGMGGIKVLSLELFNREYWKQNPLVVAKTGLEKMREIAS